MRVLGVVWVLMLGAVLVACPPPDGKKPKVDKKEPVRGTALRADLEAQLEARLSNIEAAYSKRDDEGHSRATAGAIRWMNGRPVQVLLDVDKPLSRAIRKDGFGPYLSLVVDYAYRLRRVPTGRGAHRFQSMARMFKQDDRHAKKQRKKEEKRGIVWIRSARKKEAYRAYSQNAGWAVAALALSEYGEAKLAQGARPEHLLRDVQLLGGCDRHEKAASGDEPVEEEREDKDTICDLLEGNVREDAGQLPGMGAGALDYAMGIVADGVASAGRDCIDAMRADDPGQEMIAGVEEQAACFENQKRGGMPQFDPQGTMMEGGRGNERAVSGALEGYSETSEPPTAWFSDSDFGMDGNDIVMVTTTFYEHDTDPTKSASSTVTTTWNSDGSSTTSTSITTVDKDGRLTRNFDSNGNETGGSWIGTGNNAGTSYGYENNEDGSLKSETWTDSDGSTTNVEYNDDGSCKSGCDSIPDPPPSNDDSSGDSGSSTSLPPEGEWGDAPPCTNAPEDPRAESFGEVDVLDTLIIPAPDAPEGDPDDPCLNVASSVSTELPSCQSVVLCLEETVDGTCGCGNSGRAQGDLPAGTGMCAQIQCASGQCDPETGTCKQADGEFLPGSMPPTPLPKLASPTLTHTDSARSVVLDNRTRLGAQGVVTDPSAIPPAAPPP